MKRQKTNSRFFYQSLGMTAAQLANKELSPQESGAMCQLVKAATSLRLMELKEAIANQKYENIEIADLEG